jgi:hypothetical protein
MEVGRCIKGGGEYGRIQREEERVYCVWCGGTPLSLALSHEGRGEKRRVGRLRGERQSTPQVAPHCVRFRIQLKARLSAFVFRFSLKHYMLVPSPLVGEG